LSQNEFSTPILKNWICPLAQKIQRRDFHFNHNNLASGMGSCYDCSPDLGFGIIKDLIGRSQDAVRLASGKIIYCFYFHQLVQHVGGVKKLQFIQKEPDFFELKFVPRDNSFGIKQEEFICEAVRKNLEGSVIHIRPVDIIPNDPSGKLRYVISEL
jgi:hypothetical protein